MFPEKFITSTEEVPFEIMEKLNFDMNVIQFKNHGAENQPFTSTSIKENTNTSFEVLPTEQNMDTIVHSQPMDSHLSETTEPDFVSTLLDDRTVFSSHTVNTLLLIDLEKVTKIIKIMITLTAILMITQQLLMRITEPDNPSIQPT